MSICSKDIEGNKIITSIKSHTSVTYQRKNTGYSGNLDFINAYANISEILSIGSTYTESRKEILASFKGINSVTNL